MTLAQRIRPAVIADVVIIAEDHSRSDFVDSASKHLKGLVLSWHE
jgi:hypothetical protein